MKKTAKRVAGDFPHFEDKRTVKIWTKKAGKSFQLSIEGIGGRFYGSLTRKMDDGVVGDVIAPVTKHAVKGGIEEAVKGLDKKAKLALLIKLLS